MTTNQPNKRLFSGAAGTLALTARRVTTLTVRRAAMLLLVMLLTTITAGAQDTIDGLTYNDAGGYYEINDAQDLVDLATYVNAGNNASGKTFKQTADIDMQGVSYTPIGNDEDTYYFNGIYDGDGYVIKNISHYDNGGFSLSGLFGQVKKGVVRNVNLKDCNFGGRNAGGIVGVMDDDEGSIQNCTVLGGTITGTGNAQGGHFGGIVGYFYAGTVDGCFTTTSTILSFSVMVNSSPACFT